MNAEAGAAAAASNPLMLAAALSKDRTPAGIAGAMERGDYTAQQSRLALVIKPRRETVCDRALKRPLSLGVLSVAAYEAFEYFSNEQRLQTFYVLASVPLNPEP